MSAKNPTVEMTCFFQIAERDDIKAAFKKWGRYAQKHPEGKKYWGRRPNGTEERAEADTSFFLENLTKVLNLKEKKKKSK